MTDRIAFASPVVLEGRRLRGSVKLAGERTRRNGEWLEIDPSAIAAADTSDIVGRWEHDPSRVLGRSSNGTVRFSATDDGLQYEIDLPETSYANDLLALANRGDIRGSSFEIEGLKYGFTTDLEDGSRVRRIVHIDRITDVSPVTDPAFLSNLAAFSKETPMPAEITPPETPAPPVAPPAPDAPPPVITLSAEREVYDRSLAFAQKLETPQIESALEGFWVEAGDNPNPGQLSRIEAFTHELETRTAADATAKQQREHLKLMRDIRLGRVPKAPEAGLLESDDYREAFTKYLRTGNESIMQQFAQAIAGDGTQGGFTVPDGFLNRVVERQKKIGGIAAVADSITTDSGESLRWPSNDDTGNTAAIATEGSGAGSAGADLVFGNVTLGAFTFDATGTGNNPLKVSRELIQDSAIDIEAFIARKLGERIGRKQAAAFATGAGTTEPFGLLAKTPDNMTATKTRAAAVEHIFQVDAAYRDLGNCRWVMSDTTLAKYWGATDLNGRPLYIPEAQSGLEGRPAGILMGYPLTIDNGSGDLVAFGDIELGYIIRYVRSVEVLVDPYTANAARQITYHAWARADANVQDSHAYSVSDYNGVTADAVA
jgi:HK97 family phage major capsid protein/HK97 family phage prohead protease